MSFKTAQQIEDEVRTDLDLVGEPLVSSSEVRSMINEAITVASAEILNLHEDYFLDRSVQTITSGTNEYSLPSDIFANKIRSVIYNNGQGGVYEIRRIRSIRPFEEIETREVVAGSSLYSYVITNNATSGVKLRLIPEPAQTVSNGLVTWYIRDAKRVSTGADVVDIPEFYTFIKDYVKLLVTLKEGRIDTAQFDEKLGGMLEIMKRTLAVMVPDEDTELTPDLSYYGEHN